MSCSAGSTQPGIASLSRSSSARLEATSFKANVGISVTMAFKGAMIVCSMTSSTCDGDISKTARSAGGTDADLAFKTVYGALEFVAASSSLLTSRSRLALSCKSCTCRPPVFAAASPGFGLEPAPPLAPLRPLSSPPAPRTPAAACASVAAGVAEPPGGEEGAPPTAVRRCLAAGSASAAGNSTSSPVDVADRRANEPATERSRARGKAPAASAADRDAGCNGRRPATVRWTSASVTMVVASPSVFSSSLPWRSTRAKKSVSAACSVQRMPVRCATYISSVIRTRSLITKVSSCVGGLAAMSRWADVRRWPGMATSGEMRACQAARSVQNSPSRSRRASSSFSKRR
mmetsp:Transcript_59924/g.173533  ORF Transcript_59924/g.173533 Transcript_59924/m.173533 type:complete len:346 (+) Transcript_59924:1162-2199(+)